MLNFLVRHFTNGSSVFIILVSEDVNGDHEQYGEDRDIIALRAIRFKPKQELKMDDFPVGFTNPLKRHGTLSWHFFKQIIFLSLYKVTLFTCISGAARTIRF